MTWSPRSGGGSARTARRGTSRTTSSRCARCRARCRARCSSCRSSGSSWARRSRRPRRATRSRTRARSTHSWTWRARVRSYRGGAVPETSLRRALVAIAIAGAFACVVLLALAIDSVGGHHRDLIAIFGPIIGGAFIGTGLLAWWRRPENRFGALMVALGFAYCLSGLIVTTEPWPFIAGLALIALPYAILFHILLAFPSGRIGSPGARALAGAAYLVGTVGWWACLVLEDTTLLGVPANPLLIASHPDLFKTMADVRLLVVAALIAVLFVVLARRRRRGSLPVYLAGGLVLALYAIWGVFGVLGIETPSQENLERARVIALALVPFAFLAGLLRSRVAGAAAVSELVGRLGRGASLRDELAAALGDPLLELAYWTPTGFVDSDGAPFVFREGRVSTPVENVALI